jgi:hypothetical protein
MVEKEHHQSYSYCKGQHKDEKQDYVVSGEKLHQVNRQFKKYTVQTDNKLWRLSGDSLPVFVLEHP